MGFELRRTRMVLWVSMIGLVLGGIFCLPGYTQLVKPHEFAGTFYPQNKNDLTRYIQSVLTEAADVASKVPEHIFGIIVPHAGYVYSAPVAAVSYNAIKGMDIDTVILLGASHRYPYRGIAVWPQGRFTTPLGSLDVDEKVAEEFMELKFVEPQTRYFYDEHSLEVQLPFLQTILPGAKIVPLLFGEVTYDQLEMCARTLAEVARTKKILVVVSTDLSHYHEYKEACSIDARTVDYVSHQDFFNLWTSVQLGEQRACGIKPLIAFLMYTDRIGGEVNILKYANSGDTAGDKTKVVGYMSAVAFKEENANKKETLMDHPTLTDSDKKVLLHIARLTLENYLRDQPVPEFEQGSPILYEKRGAFVTLKEHGQLRGCIGRIVADTPLYKVISDFAINAAVHDMRFKPVEYKELKDIEIEISVLTPFERVQSLDEIEVGTHGLMIQKGPYSGLLLPQVPLEYHWDRDTFLEHLCYKAGLPSGAYKDKDAVIYRFSASVFSEKEFK